MGDERSPAPAMAAENRPLVTEDKDGESNAGFLELNGPRIRTLSRLSLVGIMYFSVAGGPEGTETMVQTGGPLVTLIGIVVLGIVFAIPLSLMTAELSTMYPENGGFVLWARAAFGDLGGGMAGYLQFCSTAVDAALYPGLFVTYVSHTMEDELSPGVQDAVKAAFIFAITALNLAGISSVGHGSAAMMIFLLTPFTVIVLIAMTGTISGTTITGWQFNTSSWFDTVPKPDWPQFFLVLIWNMGMWETASVCTGEVKDVSKEFPPALAITVVLVVLNYALPIASFVGLDNSYDKYENGYYIAIIKAVGGKWWARWLGISQCVSAAGLFTNAIVKNAWMLCGMGEQGMLPTWFASRMSYTDAPGVAVMVTQSITIAMVLYGDFDAVLACDMLLYVVSLLLEIASILYLRHSEPDLPRPYKIPLSGCLLFMFFLPSVAICGFTFVAAQWIDIGITGIFLVSGFLLLGLLEWTRKQYPSSFAGVDTVMHIEQTGVHRPQNMGSDRRYVQQHDDVAPNPSTASRDAEVDVP